MDGDLNRDQLLLRLTRWALALTAAASPIYVVRWHVGPLPTTTLELLILATLGLYALLLILHRGPLPRRSPYEIPVALMLLAGVIGIFVAPDHRGALGIFRAYLVEPMAMYYVALAVVSFDAMEPVLAVIGAGAVLFSAGQIEAFISALHRGRLNPSAAPGVFDINPNSVSLYLDPLIGVAAGFALFGRGRARWGGIAALVVMLLADISTLSRGGLLALGLLALIAVASTQTWRAQVALVLAAALGAFIVTRLPILGPRISHTFDPAWGTFAERGRIWAATVRMLRDHPVFGAGVNSYQTVMAPYRAADRSLVPEPYPHNIFLTTWTELGLLGLAAFVYILLALIVRPFRALRRAGPLHRPLLFGAGAAFAMIVAHGLVDSPYWKNDLSLEFWILAALEVITLRAVGAPATAARDARPTAA